MSCPGSVVASGISANVGDPPKVFNLVNSTNSCVPVNIGDSASSNPAVVTGNPSGHALTVTFVGPGTATLTLTASGFANLVVNVTVAAGVLDLVPA